MSWSKNKPDLFRSFKIEHPLPDDEIKLVQTTNSTIISVNAVIFVKKFNNIFKCFWKKQVSPLPNLRKQTNDRNIKRDMDKRICSLTKKFLIIFWSLIFQIYLFPFFKTNTIIANHAISRDAVLTKGLRDKVWTSLSSF